jgi:hypothetical protein
VGGDGTDPNWPPESTTLPEVDNMQNQRVITWFKDLKACNRRTKNSYGKMIKHWEDKGRTGKYIHKPSLISIIGSPYIFYR